MITGIQETTTSANNLEKCLKCTICTVYCPVTAVNADYPGPKQAGPDWERYRLKDDSYYHESLRKCLNCKRCEVACPSGVRPADIIQAARIRYSCGSPSLRDRLLADTDFVGGIATRMAPVLNGILSLRPTKMLMDKIIGVDSHRCLPTYSSEKFTTWWKHNAEKNQHNFQKHVSYFHGCYVQYNFPQLGRDFVKIMNAVGYGVHLLSDERCCGVAKIANGLIKEARHDAQLNLEAVRRSVFQDRRTVIATSSTCVLTMRDEYPELLEVANADVRAEINLATRFLHTLVDRGDIKLVFRNYNKKVAYHTPCHMAKLGWGIHSIELLRMIPGLKLNVLRQECCGMSGTYGFKKENYRYSQAIGQNLFNSISAVNPDVVATDCETCKWQIEMSVHRTVMNPISILAEALDVCETRKLNGVPD